MEIRCSQCQGYDLEPGFVEETGEHARGYARWIPGPLQRGLLGNAKRRGRPRFQIDAHRCRACGHLELFAPHKV